MDPLVVEELPQLFASYLRAANEEEQRALVERHPFVFAPEIVTALGEARTQITASLKDAQDACRLIDGVAAVMDLPANGSELVKVQQSERKLLVDEDGIVDRFAETLARLLPRMPQASCETDGPAAAEGGAGGASLTAGQAGPSPNLAVAGGGGGDDNEHTDSAAHITLPWHQQPALVFTILSYLPTEDVLSNAETVCRNWFLWLCVPETSRFFWVGCVQREFPALLQQLIATEGGDLFESDWRTIAMLCVAESTEDDDTASA